MGLSVSPFGMIFLVTLFGKYPLVMTNIAIENDHL